MAERLLNPKKTRTSNWMKGFILPKASSDMDKVEGDRISMCQSIRHKRIMKTGKS